MNKILAAIRGIRDRILRSVLTTVIDHEQRITTLENTLEQKRIITPDTPKQGR